MTTVHNNAKPKNHKQSLAQEMKKKFTSFFSASIGNNFFAPSTVSASETINDIATSKKDISKNQLIADVIMSVTPVPFVLGESVCDLAAHIEKLNKSVSASAYSEPKDGFDYEYDELTQVDNRAKRTPGTFRTANKSCNIGKNRYKNVLANENTRVIIQSKPATGEDGEELSDYINANHVRGKDYNIDSLHYIATQAPLPQTMIDFWQMCYEQNVASIVMLANELPTDDDKDEEPETPSTKKPTSTFSFTSTKPSQDNFVNSNNVHKYWPNVGQTAQFGVFSVTNLEDEVCKSDPELIIRKIQLIKTNDSSSSISTPSPVVIEFYQYIGWPDMGVPKSSKPLLYIMERLNLLHSKFTDSPRPCVVHCSAGIGRTGTFCTIHIVQLQMQYHLQLQAHERAKQNFKFNIYNIVAQLKQHRCGMVQKKEQYVYCYSAILALAQEMGLSKNQC